MRSMNPKRAVLALTELLELERTGERSYWQPVFKRLLNRGLIERGEGEPGHQGYRLTPLGRDVARRMREAS